MKDSEDFCGRFVNRPYSGYLFVRVGADIIRPFKQGLVFRAADSRPYEL